MTESEPVPPSWVRNCNELVDEVWVPSTYHRMSFNKSGVPLEKIVVYANFLLVLEIRPSDSY